jgi:hypothetical protein
MKKATSKDKLIICMISGIMSVRRNTIFTAAT